MRLDNYLYIFLSQLDEKTMIEVKQLEDELSGLAKMIDENNHRLQKVESEIQKVDTGLKQQVNTSEFYIIFFHC